jgi:hypothetical protein
VQCPVLAQPFSFVNVLVAAIISRSWVSFRVLVYANHSAFGAAVCSPLFNILCITLPKASRTACDVKFSEGIRLIKCFCRLFSYSFEIFESGHERERNVERHVNLLYDVVYCWICVFQACSKQLEPPLASSTRQLPRARCNLLLGVCRGSYAPPLALPPGTTAPRGNWAVGGEQ